MNIKGTELYAEFKQKQSKEVDEFVNKYCYWAFGQEQLDALLVKLNISLAQLKEDYVGFIGGGIILRTKVDEWTTLVTEQSMELRRRLLDDPKFAEQALLYELHNHECGYTGDDTPAIRTLGLRNEVIEANPKLAQALAKAKTKYNRWCDKNIW